MRDERGRERAMFSLTTRETRSNLREGIYVERAAHLSTTLTPLAFLSRMTRLRRGSSCLWREQKLELGESQRRTGSRRSAAA